MFSVKTTGRIPLFQALTQKLRSSRRLLGKLFWPRWRSLFLALALGLVLSQPCSAQASVTLAQLPGLGADNTSAEALGWVSLGGRQVFQIAAPSAALGQRREQIHENLVDIREDYLALENPVVNVTTQETEAGQPKIYVNGQYLMTVTPADANLQGMTTAGLVESLTASINETLTRAYEHRQPEYRQQQFILIGFAFLTIIILMIGLHYVSHRLVQSTLENLRASPNPEEPTENQRHQLQDLRDRLLPLLQGLLLVSGLIWSLGRFPETRVVQQDLLSTLKIPIILGIVAIVAYVGIRLSYALVDRIALGLTEENGFSSHYSRRARLRISTLSSVIKNITNFVWIAIGFLVALSVTGINLGLLLASVGIIGLALSLAAQNLVKGAIQGFFIVLEDQFAIGDVVQIGDDAGLVEKLNLRITQLRDTAGRLITIPTSDITRVANYSLHWSQADLKIPVHYNADINQMLDITRQVGEALQTDAQWKDLILDDPQILGVDDFGDSAIIIRVWIKTQPMKQWDISREYRRRFKQAVEAAGAEIPFPQRDVWLHPSSDFKQLLRDSPGHMSSRDHQNGNGQHPSAQGDIAKERREKTEERKEKIEERNESSMF